MIKIEPCDYQILQKILGKYPYRFYVYGSRTKEVVRKFSDLDLCYQDDIPDEVVCQIKEELEESDLPFIVELVNWKHMRPQFQELIRKDLKVIN